MNILSDYSLYVNGGSFFFCMYLLVRLNNSEKARERLEKSFSDYRNKQIENNKDCGYRLTKVESYLSRFSSNWK